jgi:3-oxoacyl-[acyl-carrier protein] reductase
MSIFARRLEIKLTVCRRYVKRGKSKFFEFVSILDAVQKWRGSYARIGAGEPAEQRGTKMDLGLKGLRAVVTGGTRGIGFKIAETLAGEGVDVAICSRNVDDAKAVAADLARKGVSTIGRGVDVADGAAISMWVEEAATLFGGLDIVVGNVSALAIGNDEESWRQCFNVDMLGTVRLVNAAMPYLEKSQSASIVTIASVSGREIDFAAGPYGSFKAALTHYTQGLAFSLAPKGIRANTVSPGNTYFAGGVWENIEKNNPELFAASLALNPTGRMATPQEIANAAVFLASPAASFVYGTNLVVDGALTRGVQL